jgi:lysyl-tRNA synthetase class 2
MTWWIPKNFAKRQPYLKERMRIIKAVRSFFDEQAFLEVETPILQVCPVMDTHIHAFKTELLGVDLSKDRSLYLHTSPEFAMKKLMVAGVENLYQICHVFRNAENTALHSPEFTMIEWYRSDCGYEEIMRDCEKLLRNLEVKEFRYKDKRCNPHQDWQRLSVNDAFKTMAGIELEAHLENTQSFAQAAADCGIRTTSSDSWDDIFHAVMAEKIEPHLGMGAPTILYDYPASMASLSRRKPNDPRWAERFELYVCGIELANAFSELTDAKEQRARFIEEMDIKEKLYGERYPIDEEFLAALERGLPESGGIALGVDRLVMLACGASSIDEVLWAGKP